MVFWQACPWECHSYGTSTLPAARRTSSRFRRPSVFFQACFPFLLSATWSLFFGRSVNLVSFRFLASTVNLLVLFSVSALFHHSLLFSPCVLSHRLGAPVPDAPFSFRIHLLSALNNFSWKQYALRSFICSSAATASLNQQPATEVLNSHPRARVLLSQVFPTSIGGESLVGYARNVFPSAVHSPELTWCTPRLTWDSTQISIGKRRNIRPARALCLRERCSVIPSALLSSPMQGGRTYFWAAGSFIHSSATAFDAPPASLFVFCWQITNAQTVYINTNFLWKW